MPSRLEVLESLKQQLEVQVEKSQQVANDESKLLKKVADRGLSFDENEFVPKISAELASQLREFVDLAQSELSLAKKQLDSHLVKVIRAASKPFSVPDLQIGIDSLNHLASPQSQLSSALKSKAQQYAADIQSAI